MLVREPAWGTPCTGCHYLEEQMILGPMLSCSAEGRSRACPWHLPVLFSVLAHPDFCQIFMCSSVKWKLIDVKELMGESDHHIEKCKFLWPVISEARGVTTDMIYVFILAKDNIPGPHTRLVVDNDSWTQLNKTFKNFSLISWTFQKESESSPFET